jgi:hypothetical protein
MHPPKSAEMGQFLTHAARHYAERKQAIAALARACQAVEAASRAGATPMWRDAPSAFKTKRTLLPMLLTRLRRRDALKRSKYMPPSSLRKPGLS